LYRYYKAYLQFRLICDKLEIVRHEAIQEMRVGSSESASISAFDQVKDRRQNLR
jgi:hypothetical protein